MLKAKKMVIYSLGLLIMMGCLFPKDKENRLKVRDQAPGFSLSSASGDVITLRNYQNQKNVVLIFYRGYW